MSAANDYDELHEENQQRKDTDQVYDTKYTFAVHSSSLQGLRSQSVLIGDPLFSSFVEHARSSLASFAREVGVLSRIGGQQGEPFLGSIESRVYKRGSCGLHLQSIISLLFWNVGRYRDLVNQSNQLYPRPT